MAWSRTYVRARVPARVSRHVECRHRCALEQRRLRTARPFARGLRASAVVIVQCGKGKWLMIYSETELLSAPLGLRAQPLDVLIVGSGPAGVAVAEELLDAASRSGPTLKVGIVERGRLLTLSHINNILANHERRRFIDRFGVHPWDGDFADGGTMLLAVGGRGVAAGAHLRRFDSVDFNLWRGGEWPEDVVKTLPGWYTLAEQRRRVSSGDLGGDLQLWAKTSLADYNPLPPAVGVDRTPAEGFHMSRGYDSPAARLWEMLLRDRLNGSSQLILCPATYATRLIPDSREQGIGWVKCLDISRSVARDFELTARCVVLACSPVESARLLLNSRLNLTFAPVGCFLAEHIERRAKIELNVRSQGPGISLVLTPGNEGKPDLASRFQIHLRCQSGRDKDALHVDLGGFAAMEPQFGNSVALSGADAFDEHGVCRARTTLHLTKGDKEQADNLSDQLIDVGSRLGGRFITKEYPQENVRPVLVKGDRIQVMPKGRSYHEAGTLRMGSNPSASVTDSWGRVRPFSNLFVADASLFPSIGIANPMLTITALAYRVAAAVLKELGHEDSNAQLLDGDSNQEGIGP
jgi:hypothetical protein